MSLTPSPIDTQLTEARNAFAITFRRWAGQWSQPQLLKLAAGCFGIGHFHSSQISGYATGKLIHPSPKSLLVTGWLNLAIAAANAPNATARQALYDEGAPKLPGVLEPLWRGRSHMVDSNGTPLGPTECFEAFVGLRTLGTEGTPRITDATLPLATRALGRYLRTTLTAQGVDIIEDGPTIAAQHPLLHALVLGRYDGDAPTLTSALPELAAATHTTPDALWDVVDAAVSDGVAAVA